MLQFKPSSPAMIDIGAAELANRSHEIPSWLRAGKVVVIRNLRAVRLLREQILLHAETLGGEPVRRELEMFYEQGDELQLQTLFVLSQVLKKVRADRFISQLFAKLLVPMQLPEPIYVDGAIPRLALPPHLVERARQSDLFIPSDFKRETATGDTEIFMPKPANIHRDFNRDHWTLMCNLWFPLHDCPANELVRLWPQHYHNADVRDQDNTSENQSRLGEYAAIELKFGDAIMFHGEIPHTSPDHPSAGRRQSFDMRIACACFDDNRGYRGNFVNLNNFLTGEAGAPTLGLDYTALARDNLPDVPDPLHSANYFWLLAQQGANIRGREIQRILQIYSLYPFAEDRYVALARLAVRRGTPQLGKKILESLCEMSPNFFWQFLSGEMLEEMGAIAPAVAAYRRALSSAASSHLQAFAPIDYASDTPVVPPTEQYARELNGRLGRLAGVASRDY